MIQARDAFNLVLSHQLKQKSHFIQLEDALHSILAEDVFADLDQPPFDRVMMDGIAIKKSNLLKFNKFKILSLIPAGVEEQVLPDGEFCFEVMTGAICPMGADLIIPFEQIKIENGIAHLDSKFQVSSSFIHSKGSDYKRGELLLKKDTFITPPVIAILASCGLEKVHVFKKPQIVILSTGDELVDINSSPLPHQIRWSNGVTLKSELSAFGMNQVELIKMSDDREKVKTKIKSLLGNVDILVLTGAVSAGRFDFIPEILNELFVEKVFHKVAQKPGKPLWFGHFETQTFVFGLPGNPVSALINLRKFVIPFITREKITKVKLDQVISPPNQFTYYCPVKLNNDKGLMIATPISGNGSGDFFHLRDSDGFVEILNQNETMVDFYSWGRSF